MLAQLADATLASLAEAYVQGRIDVEGDLLEAVPAGRADRCRSGFNPAQRFARLLLKHSSRQDQAAVGYHYDVGNDFYRLWLDERMVYSCAYFRTGEESIDEAQRAKLDHICRKLRLSRENVFWMWAADGADWSCTRLGTMACAPSALRCRRTSSNSRASGLQPKGSPIGSKSCCSTIASCAGALALMRSTKLPASGCSSMSGSQICASISRRSPGVLRDRGLFLNHGITSSDLDNRPIGSGVGDFVHKYVFPYGELPHLHVATREMARSGFEILDVESLAPALRENAAALVAPSRCSALEAAARSVSRPHTAHLARVSCRFGSWLRTRLDVRSINFWVRARRVPAPAPCPLTRDYMYRLIARVTRLCVKSLRQVVDRQALIPMGIAANNVPPIDGKARLESPR